MKKLTIYTSFAKQMNLLSDAERGRLFTAMLTYAESGEVIKLIGNERFLWDTAKQDIDRQTEAYESLCARNKENAKRLAPSRSDSQPVAPSRTDWEERKEKERKETSPNGEEDALSRSLDEFRKYRKQIGKKLTPLAETRLMNELEKLSGGDKETKIEILNRSIMNGWTGVFPLKEQKKRDYEEHPVQPGKFDHLFADLDGD